MNDLAEALAELQRMSTGELCERYRGLFGQPVRTRHKAYLVRKAAWRLQALTEGDPSERARRRAAKLAHDADVRLMPTKPPPGPGTAAGGAGGGTRVVKAPTPAAPMPADPRLGQAFNSLGAQREAAEAFVASQPAGGGGGSACRSGTTTAAAPPAPTSTAPPWPASWPTSRRAKSTAWSSTRWTASAARCWTSPARWGRSTATG